MIDRCENRRHRQYKDYGGRGVCICTRWRNSFLAFLADMGERPPGTTLERRNNAKGYGPGNCYWATRQEQNRNRRDNRFLTYKGRRKLLRDWAEEYGLKRLTLYTRVFAYGWAVEKALLTPVRVWGR